MYDELYTVCILQYYMVHYCTMHTLYNTTGRTINCTCTEYPEYSMNADIFICVYKYSRHLHTLQESKQSKVCIRSTKYEERKRERKSDICVAL